MTHALSRRRFLNTMLAAGLAPQIVPLRVLGGETAPSNRIRLGHLGVGGQGTGLLNNFLGVENALSVAVADPFRSRREHAGGLIKARQGHEPKLYNDFREMLADPSIDAVVIATPDHWHVPAGLAAVRAGKDVYIEKPLGKSLAQNRALREACAKHQRVFQYGTMQRSQELLKRGVELVLNGRIGKLERIDVWAPAGRGGGSLEEIPVPEGLDYDLYIGPAPMRPCSKDRLTNQASYHCADYALGYIAGWGAHPLDIAVWACDSDQAGPATYEGRGEFPTPDALFNTCATWDVQIAFADGVKMHFTDDQRAKPAVLKYRQNWDSNGTTFWGSEGWISLSRGGVAASNPEWFKQRDWPEGARRVRYHGRYYKAFAEAVQQRTPGLTPVDDAVRSDAISHLSLLAITSGGPVVWDPKAYRIQSPDALNAQLSIAVRGDWAQS